MLSSAPRHSFTIPVKSEAYDNDEDDDEGLMVLLKFTYTDKYPEEKPLLEFEETDNVDEDVLEEFMQYLDEQVRDIICFFSAITIITYRSQKYLF